jgi:hypothetical protein
MDNDWNPKRFDEWGNEYVLDENGNKLPPAQTSKQVESSGFTHYESSQHCGLCGSLTCRGNCFK